MDPERIVFDISSDEESYGLKDGPGRADFDWIARFLGVAGDDENISDEADSDEVVVLGEVKGSGKSKSTKQSQTVTAENDDDDDCVVLDGDPDKPVVEDDANLKADSDELVVVGEKGQVACRDFPHPRHLCVTYSFSTTPHEQYCCLCHCYVCDIPAPCALWANTSSAGDHCHAAAKVGTWEAQRNNLKLGIIALPKPPQPAPARAPVLNLPETSVTGLLPQLNPIPCRNIAPTPPILRPTQNLLPRPSASSVKFSVPTVSTGSRTQQQAALPLRKNRFQPRVPPPLRFVPSSANITPARPRPGPPMVNPCHRFPNVNQGSPFKRPAIFRPHRTSVRSSGPLPEKQWGSNHVAPRQYPTNPSPPPVQSSLTPPITWQNSCTPGSNAGLSPAFGATAPPPLQQFVHPHGPLPAGSQGFFQPSNQFRNNAGQIPSPGPDIIHIEGGPVDYNPSWVNNALNNQQPPPPFVDPFQLRATEPSNNQPPVTEPANLNLTTDIGNWLLDKPLTPAHDGSSVPQSNYMYSPEQSSIDLGFFDFEPWSNLAHT